MVQPISENFQPVKGPHINQLIAMETARVNGVKVCTSKSRVVVSWSVVAPIPNVLWWHVIVVPAIPTPLLQCACRAEVM